MAPEGNLMRRTMAGAACLLATCMTMTSPAHAGTVSLQDGYSSYLTYEGGVGEKNVVTATMDRQARTLVLTDPGALSITASPRPDNAAAEHCVFERRLVTCAFASGTLPSTILELGDGNDTAWTNTFGIVDGGAGDDRLTQTGLSVDPANSWLIGGPGADVLTGGPGDDALIGGTGPDLIDGGGGAVDEVWWQIPVRVSAPIDTDSPLFPISVPERLETRLDSPAGGVHVTLDGVADDGHRGGLERDNVLNVERVWGTPSDEVLVSGPAGARLNGLDGNDRFVATGGNRASAWGGTGDDTFDLRDSGFDPLASFDSYVCEEGVDEVMADPFDRLRDGYPPEDCETVTVEGL